MREIKFRGKTINNYEWVYGYLVDEFHIAWKDSNGKSYEEEVIPETIGQYTGLKDVDGKEVYEGDFVTITTYDTYGLRVKYNNCEYGLYYGREYIGGLCEEDLKKVVGNIYNIPELMKGE